MSFLNNIRSDLKALLEQRGFDVGACLTLRKENLNFDMKALENWLAQGAHADMHFMENNAQARRDSTFILENAQTAMTVLVPYATGKRVRQGKPSEQTPPQEKKIREKNPQNEVELLEYAASSPNNSHKIPLLQSKLVARYSQGKDYHKVIKKHLSEVFFQFKTSVQTPFDFRIVVDSIPFFDRAHARLAGLGFVGKNTMLIRPGLGSYFFIATVLLSLSENELLESPAVEAPDAAKVNPIFKLDCGDCKECLEACPTQAITRPYFLDSNKCLSYLTIEHRDTVEEHFLPFFRDTIYGCDICQEVCPYNSTTLDLVKIPELRKKHEPLLTHSAQDVAQMDAQKYEEWFAGTAMTRAKYSGLVRNALYHLHAVKAEILNAILESRRADPEPLIQKTVQQLLQLSSASKIRD